MATNGKKEQKPLSRGGYREDAGRKGIFAKKTSKLVDLEEDFVNDLTEMGFKISPFLREAGEIRLKHLKAMKERDARKAEKKRA